MTSWPFSVVEVNGGALCGVPAEPAPGTTPRRASEDARSGSVGRTVAPSCRDGLRSVPTLALAALEQLARAAKAHVLVPHCRGGICRDGDPSVHRLGRRATA
jgi:hypothetical protein